MRLVEKNFDGEHEIVETDQEVVHVMTKTNSPRILPESLQPNPEVFLPWVRAGVSAEVNDLNRSYRAQLLRSMEVTEEIKKAARDAVAKAGAKTDREKAAALYAFTNDTLIERGGGSATRSLLEKRGNPFALFGALLEAEGVPFDVAMARGVPKAGDDEPQAYFLDPQRYRHPMLRIAPREGRADVDRRGARLQPFGALPSAVSASEIFVTSDKESRIETLPTLPDDESTALDLSTVVELGTGQAARVTIDMTFHNVQAWNARERIKNFTADVRKTIAAQISNGIATGIELEKFDFPTLDDNAAPFKIHIEGTIANFLREGSGTLETPVLLQPQALFKMLSGRSKRKLPSISPATKSSTRSCGSSPTKRSDSARSRPPLPRKATRSSTTSRSRKTGAPSTSIASSSSARARCPHPTSPLFLGFAARSRRPIRPRFRSPTAPPSRVRRSRARPSRNPPAK